MMPTKSAWQEADEFMMDKAHTSVLKSLYEEFDPEFQLKDTILYDSYMEGKNEYSK